MNTKYTNLKNITIGDFVKPLLVSPQNIKVEIVASDGFVFTKKKALRNLLKLEAYMVFKTVEVIQSEKTTMLKFEL